MKALKVSVIIPVYKVEKYIECCLNSVLRQTFTDFEVIVVDDGSPDGCPQICDKYAELDNRVRVIHKANGGLSSARNAGLDACHGEYVCFVDSDDYIEPDYLSFLVSKMDAGNYDFVSCAANFVDENGVFLRRNDYPVEAKEIIDEKWETYFHTNLIEDAVWNKLYKRAIFSDLRFAEGLIFEDSEIILKILKRCDRIYFTSYYLYNYRIRAGSILGYTGSGTVDTNFSPKKLDLLKVYQICAAEMTGTVWEKSYYKRMIYTCADFSLQLYRSGLKARELRAQLNAYFERAVRFYGLSNFPFKERIAILIEMHFPAVWVWVRSIKIRKTSV